MTVVVDASLIVAGLVDTGADGRWAERDIAGEALAAPHLLSVEVANVLRRVARSGELSSDIASLAHAELRDLRVEVFDDDIVPLVSGSCVATSPPTTPGTSRSPSCSTSRSPRSTADSPALPDPGASS